MDDVLAGAPAPLLVLVFSGLPLAPLAGIVGLVTVRRAPRRWPDAAAGVFRAALLVQAGSGVTTVALLALGVAHAGWGELVRPLGQIFIVSTLASAAALPAWRSAMLASASTPPTPVRGAERFRPGSDLR